MFTQSETYFLRLSKMAQNNKAWESLKGSSILVAGATGMIGSCLVDYLMFLNTYYSAKIKIYALNRSRKRAEQRFGYDAAKAGLCMLEHDITKPLKLDIKIDYIVHAATNADPASYASFPVDTMISNFLGTKQLLDYMYKCNGRRMLLVSSGEVYGQSVKDGGFDEDSYGAINPLYARSCYPISKLAAETLCVCYSKQYETDSVIVRPSHVYGPTALKTDTRAVTSFIDNAKNGLNIVMKSAGTQVRNYCYVCDCVEAMLYCLTYGKNGAAYNIANENSIVSIREMAEKIARAGGVEVVIEAPDELLRSGFTTVQRGVLNAKALRNLGWSAHVYFDEGILETLAVIRETESASSKIR